MITIQSETSAKACVTIASPLGLHARPAAKLVKLAQSFSCDITLHTGNASADAQSILDILALSASNGSTVTVQCDGIEARAACEQIVHFLETEMGEHPHG